MNFIAHAFSSKSKFSVLYVLATTQGNISLRELSELTKIPIYSVEGAIKAIAKIDLIKEQKKDRYRLLSFNHKHSYAPLLKSIFELIQKSKTSSDETNLQIRARESLRFSTQMIQMIRKAKK